MGWCFAVGAEALNECGEPSPVLIGRRSCETVLYPPIFFDPHELVWWANEVRMLDTEAPTIRAQLKLGWLRKLWICV